MNALILLLRVLVIGLFTSATIRAADSSPATNTPALSRTDANGNALRRAPTGHVSNYDEAKVGNYTLPDPLVLQNGKSVTTARAWVKQRRPEILKLYETE